MTLTRADFPPPVVFTPNETLHAIALPPLASFLHRLTAPEHLVKLNDILDRYRTPKSYHRVDVRELDSSDLPPSSPVDLAAREGEPIELPAEAEPAERPEAVEGRHEFAGGGDKEGAATVGNSEEVVKESTGGVETEVTPEETPQQAGEPNPNPVPEPSSASAPQPTPSTPPPKSRAPDDESWLDPSLRILPSTSSPVRASQPNGTSSSPTPDHPHPPRPPKRRIRELRLDLRTLDAAALFALETWRRDVLGLGKMDMEVPDSVWYKAPESEPSPEPEPEPVQEAQTQPEQVPAPPAVMKKKKGRPSRKSLQLAESMKLANQPLLNESQQEAYESLVAVLKENETVDVLGGSGVLGDGADGAPHGELDEQSILAALNQLSEANIEISGEPESRQTDQESDSPSTPPTPDIDNRRYAGDEKDAEFKPPHLRPAVSTRRTSRRNESGVETTPTSTPGRKKRFSDLMSDEPVEEGEASSLGTGRRGGSLPRSKRKRSTSKEKEKQTEINGDGGSDGDQLLSSASSSHRSSPSKPTGKRMRLLCVEILIRKRGGILLSESRPTKPRLSSPKKVAFSTEAYDAEGEEELDSLEPEEEEEEREAEETGSAGQEDDPVEDQTRSEEIQTQTQTPNLFTPIDGWTSVATSMGEVETLLSEARGSRMDIDEPTSGKIQTTGQPEKVGSTIQEVETNIQSLGDVWASEVELPKKKKKRVSKPRTGQDDEWGFLKEI